jgi:predicted DNA-binding protein
MTYLNRKRNQNMKNDFVAFRVPTDLKNRLTNVADAEYLSSSDIVRRAMIDSIKTLEEKHHLSSSRPPSIWQIANR